MGFFDDVIKKKIDSPGGHGRKQLQAQAAAANKTSRMDRSAARREHGISKHDWDKLPRGNKKNPAKGTREWYKAHQIDEGSETGYVNTTIPLWKRFSDKHPGLNLTGPKEFVGLTSRNKANTGVLDPQLKAEAIRGEMERQAASQERRHEQRSIEQHVKTGQETYTKAQRKIDDRELANRILGTNLTPGEWNTWSESARSAYAQKKGIDWKAEKAKRDAHEKTSKVPYLEEDRFLESEEVQTARASRQQAQDAKGLEARRLGVTSKERRGLKKTARQDLAAAAGTQTPALARATDIASEEDFVAEWERDQMAAGDQADAVDYRGRRAPSGTRWPQGDQTDAVESSGARPRRSHLERGWGPPQARDQTDAMEDIRAPVDARGRRAPMRAPEGIEDLRDAGGRPQAPTETPRELQDLMDTGARQALRARRGRIADTEMVEGPPMERATDIARAVQPDQYTEQLDRMALPPELEQSMREAPVREAPWKRGDIRRTRNALEDYPADVATRERGYMEERLASRPQGRIADYTDLRAPTEQARPGFDFGGAFDRGVQGFQRATGYAPPGQQQPMAPPRQGPPRGQEVWDRPMVEGPPQARPRQPGMEAGDRRMVEGPPQARRQTQRAAGDMGMVEGPPSASGPRRAQAMGLPADVGMVEGPPQARRRTQQADVGMIEGGPQPAARKVDQTTAMEGLAPPQPAARKPAVDQTATMEGLAPPAIAAPDQTAAMEGLGAAPDIKKTGQLASQSLKQLQDLEGTTTPAMRRQQAAVTPTPDQTAMLEKLGVAGAQQAPGGLQDLEGTMGGATRAPGQAPGGLQDLEGTMGGATRAPQRTAAVAPTPDQTAIMEQLGIAGEGAGRPDPTQVGGLEDLQGTIDGLNRTQERELDLKVGKKGGAATPEDMEMVEDPLQPGEDVDAPEAGAPAGIESRIEDMSRGLEIDVEAERAAATERINAAFAPRYEALARAFATSPGARGDLMSGDMERQFEQLAAAHAQAELESSANIDARVREETRQNVSALLGIQESRAGREAQEAQVFGEVPADGGVGRQSLAGRSQAMAEAGAKHQQEMSVRAANLSENLELAAATGKVRDANGVMVETLEASGQRDALALEAKGLTIEAEGLAASSSQFDSDMKQRMAEFAAEHGLNKDQTEAAVAQTYAGIKQADRELDLSTDRLITENEQFLDTIGFDKDRFSATIKQQEMDRMVQVSELSRQYGLDVKRFERAMDESDRAFSEDSNRFAQQFGLEGQRFALARAETEANVNLRGQELEDARIAAARTHNLNVEQFSRAADLADRAQDASERQFADQFGLQRDQFVEAKRQFDVSEINRMDQFDRSMSLQEDELDAMVNQQNLDRQQRNDQFADQFGLDRERFAQANMESERAFNEGVRQFGQQFGLDNARFAQAVKQANHAMDYQDKTFEQAVFESGRNFDFDTERFTEAVRQWEANFEEQKAQIIVNNGLEEARFNEAQKQYNDARSDKMVLMDSMYGGEVTTINEETGEAETNWVSGVEYLRHNPGTLKAMITGSNQDKEMAGALLNTMQGFQSTFTQRPAGMSGWEAVGMIGGMATQVGAAYAGRAPR